MKKIIGMVIASLLFCNIGFAGYRVLEHEKQVFSGYNDSLTTLCIDGYKFLITTRTERYLAISTVQFFEERDGKSLPAKC